MLVDQWSGEWAGVEWWWMCVLALMLGLTCSLWWCGGVGSSGPCGCTLAQLGWCRVGCPCVLGPVLDCN